MVWNEGKWDVKIALTDFGELVTRKLAEEYKPYGLEQNKEIAKMWGNTAKVARDDIEKKLGKTVISNKNSLDYQYLEENTKITNSNK